MSLRIQQEWYTLHSIFLCKRYFLTEPFIIFNLLLTVLKIILDRFEVIFIERSASKCRSNQAFSLRALSLYALKNDLQSAMANF